MSARRSAPPLRQPPVTLRVCNRTSDTAMIAFSYVPVGDVRWRNQGWTQVVPGQCLDIFKTDQRTFYGRAEVKGNSNQFWGHDVKRCVEYPGPYDFFSMPYDPDCNPGKARDFTTFHSDGSPVYVWNLVPPV